METSDRIGSLAALVSNGNEIIAAGKVSLPAGQRSAQSLLPAIQSLMHESGWLPNRLGLICVTTGPGSFTGLRIGVTTAKTLAYATGVPLVEVHTLAAMASGVSTAAKRLWTILDAQRQELFVARFDADSGDHTTTLPETQVLPVEQWFAQLRPGDCVSGPPLKKLASQLPVEVVVADEAEWSAQAEVVGRLGIKAFHDGNTTDAMQLVPRYYRKSAAEEKADRLAEAAE